MSGTQEQILTNVVSNINYADGQSASYLYDGTGDLVKMEDWNGTTTFAVDLLDRLVKVIDHNGRVVEYGWDAVGNKTSIGFPDGSQVDYWYDAENQIVQVQDHEGGITLFEYDPNGKKRHGDEDTGTVLLSCSVLANAKRSADLCFMPAA